MKSKLVIRFIQLLLLTMAAFTSVSAVVAAYPTAVNLVGEFAGAIFVIATEVIIYTSWLFIGMVVSETDETTYIKIGVGFMAILFAVIAVVAVHQRPDVIATESATIARVNDDSDYRSAEAARVAALRVATEQLNKLDPKKSPIQYKDTMTLVNKLSVATEKKQPSVDEPAGDAVASVFNWVAASLFQVFTPALLLLSGIFGRYVTQRGMTNVTNVVQSTLPKAHSPVTSGSTLLQLVDPQTAPTVVDDVVADTVDSLQLLNELKNDQRSNDMIAKIVVDIMNRVVPMKGGNVTKQQVLKLYKCTGDDVNVVFKICVERGFLKRIGSGRMMRHVYHV